MEVPIGNFRADMVLQYEQSHRRVLLVELERHLDQIFKKDNRLRSKVTHASQQVEDWIGEIRSGKNNIPDWLKREYVVEGAVVIGRSKNLTVSQKDTLRVINTNRIVKIMTYDDLLEQMMRLISIL
ncbi:Shedu anti-phage system protein SduA domain-containing protein [Pseudomonas viridiflava]|uniref:Shedu anti-phage system protein SduA domain-containing protein n=1 Tax=Pseudomonas viridiflava TaxID=33069 RepID=UPI0019804D08|nr:Shedu anti-phage system protein SduA domain-containing protein [Pseudomonas viridiflava]